MAPKKKTKKHEQELEEEAMAEWLSRGHAIKDFTMEKMLAIWLEEDGEADEEGEDSLNAKEELIKGLRVLDPIIEQTKELVDRVKETVKEEAVNAITTAWKYAEIPPLKRRRLLREHVVHVLEMDREANKYGIIRQRVKDEWETSQAAEKELAFGLKKRNARKAPLLLRSREMKEEADREQQARLMEDIERKRRARMDAEIADKQRQRAAREEIAEVQQVYRRKMNMKFWQKQYVNAKQYAEQHSLSVAEQRQVRFDEQVDMMRAEIAAMNNEELADYEKAFDRNPTTSSAGVFSTAYNPGEWESSIEGGHREGLDEATVEIFDSRSFEVEHELLRAELMEAQSRVLALREKVEILEQVKANLLTDKRTIMERKERILVEIRQVNLEHEELARQLAGPPRREPTEGDKLQFHTLVTRKAALMKQAQDLNARESNIQRRAELAERSDRSLRPILDKELKSEAALSSKVACIDKTQLDLPMVVGRSIQRDAGVLGIPSNEDSRDLTIPIPNPSKLYTDVTMESKLKLLETASHPVKEHYKRAKQLIIEDWKTKELKALGENELDVTKNRLSSIRDRMVEHQKDTLRADLVQAVTRFHQGNAKLRRCIFPLKGHIDWWHAQDHKRSSGMLFDQRTNLVFLDPDTNCGRMAGCVRLPKNGTFRISMAIKVASADTRVSGETALIAEGEEKELVDHASDKVVFYVGSDFDALQEHTFRDQAGTPVPVGTVSFDFHGSRLCFSIDLNRRLGMRPRDARYHICLVNSATYEERLQDFREEESQMRLIQKEKHVLSELVKTLRMQTKKTSGERCADLLEELVQVETSTARVWDSTLLHGHLQRFERATFAEKLRAEIKKELASQIDQDVLRRQGRQTVQVVGDTTSTSSAESDLENTKRRDASRLEFLARKHALIEPQYLISKRSLGKYCSFKAPEKGEVNHPNTDYTIRAPGEAGTPLGSLIIESYRKESLVMGLRLEWREGKTKMFVMHKLFEPGEGSSGKHVLPKWCSVGQVNAVFLANAFSKALKICRGDEVKQRDLLKRKDEQVYQLRQETELTIQQEREADRLEAVEDIIRSKKKESDMSRRAKLFRADAIRTITYNHQVSAQVDFLAQRKMNVIEQQTSVGDDAHTLWKAVLQEVKEGYIEKFVEGRLALVKKTWERKEKRIHEQRDKDRRERAFRIRQEQQLVEAVSASKTEQLAELQREQAQRFKDQLKIPKFGGLVNGAFACEHRELKAWGSSYGSGTRCKSCSKEMSKSFEDPDHARGADPQLDRDIEQHRAQVTGGLAIRLRNPTHFDQVELERVRLEKEAREIELSEAMLYDRTEPKSIEEFNYRHNMNRHPESVDGSAPIYQRSVADAHRAAFQEELLYHGRLKNFHFRIQQLTGLHAHITTMIAVQNDFLENVLEENDFVLAKLPLVERDHARAVMLIKEDEAALSALTTARKQLELTRKERERAYYSLEGVEEEAEFAEFHAPSLIESSEVMSGIVERMRDEASQIEAQILQTAINLQSAEKELGQVDCVLTRLYFRHQGSRLRTRYGFCRVVYYREEDRCVVVSPEKWTATIFIQIEEIVMMEAADRQAEAAMMDAEDQSMKDFIKEERRRESKERNVMGKEEQNIVEIVAWRQKKSVEETLLRTRLCEEELFRQFQYETETRKDMIKAAAEEAKRLNQYTRVSLKRRALHGKVQARASRIDIIRVTRACEKRLAMASIEQALLHQDKQMRQKFQQERDEDFITKLSGAIVADSLSIIVMELCGECIEEEAFDMAKSQRLRNHGLVASHVVLSVRPNGFSSLSLYKQIQLDRLWLSRRHKAELMYKTWQRESSKLLALRLEIARREEILRLQEAERLRLEARRKEMLAEDRYCRKFYLEEMVLCIQERKAMANAEIEMREYIRQLELESMKVKYAAMIDERNKANDKAARRLEIKLGKNEKHRLYREWTQIKIEDELATRVRDEEIARAQAEALAQLFDRFLVQQAVEGKLAAEREAARLAERLREAQRIEAEKRAAFEAKLVQERMMATVEAFYLVARLELEWMNAAERASFWRNKSDQLRANLVPMEADLKRILQERDHVVSDAKAKRAHAEQCKQRAKDADAALQAALSKEEECLKLYRKVHFLNSTMDSEVLHGRPQRFRTSYLRDQLQTRYFYLLTESIVRGAIVECNRREMVRLQEKLCQIEEERASKMREIGVLKRKRRRHFHMQLKRSALGEKIFGISQKRMLRERFQQWVKLWSQRVMVRASFEVKHGLLMQKHRLQQKQTQLMKEDINTKLTILHQHQKRRVRCRLCKLEYTEEQNNRYSCSYHPGAYELACVKSCVTRQPNSISAMTTTTANCMMHRARRWLCCDATDEGRYGSNGCSRRFHLPQRDNPALQQLVQTKEKQDTTLLVQMQDQLDELKERDILGKAKLANKMAVAKIEMDLASKRAVAARYFTLDRRNS